MPKKENTFNSSLGYLNQIKQKFKKTFPDDVDLYEQLVALYSSDLRAVIDEMAGLKPAERKEPLAPYLAMQKRLKKFDPKGYRPPPGMQMRWVARAFDVVIGWLKNRHKYKDGELLPPASDEQLQQLQDAISAKTAPHPDSIAAAEGNKGSFLSSSFVDLYKICNGMASHVRMHDGIRLLPIDEILEAYNEFETRDIPDNVIPLGDDGAGNYYALNLSNSDIEDVNHEDDERIPTYPSLGKFLSKAHKVSR